MVGTDSAARSERVRNHRPVDAGERFFVIAGLFSGMVRLRELIVDDRVNAAIGWSLILALLVLAVAEAARVRVALGGLTAALAVTALVPPVARRDAYSMLPWELLVLAAVPSAVRLVVAPYTALSYLTVATLALVIAVELHVFTPVEMTPGFAVAFVVVATMAVAALWTIVQFVSDGYLGTRFLVDQPSLMFDLAAASVAGIAAGIGFHGYFRRYDRFHPGAGGDPP